MLPQYTHQYPGRHPVLRGHVRHRSGGGVDVHPQSETYQYFNGTQNGLDLSQQKIFPVENRRRRCFRTIKGPVQEVAWKPTCE